MALSSDIQHPRIGVGIILIRGNKILLGQRKGPRSPGFYGLPGGFLEKNESFEDGAKREIVEETGLKDVSLYPIFLISGISDSIQFVDIVFYGIHKNGEPTVRETNRVEKWEWFSISELPSPLYKPTILALKSFIANFYFYKINLWFQRWFPRRSISVQFIDSLNSEEQ